MRKIKILYIHHTFRSQSYNSQLWEFAKRVDRSRYEIWISCLREGGPYEERFRALGLAVHNFDMKSVFDPRIVPRVAAFLRSRKADIVHTGLLPADIYGRIAARISGVPFIVTTIHNIDDYRREKRLFLQKMMDRATMLLNTHVITCARAVEKEIARWPEARRKLKTIYYGIDSERFHPEYETGDLRCELGLEKGCTVVGTVARHFPQKGLETLLEAAARVAEVHPHVRFLMVGDGPLTGTLKRMARELGLHGRVRFAGFREDIPEVLAAMDIFVLPSLWEGLPNSIIEAMLSEKPVIATSVCGIPEEVDDGVTGFLVPPQDPRRLAGALIRLLEKPGMREAMGKRGRKKALTLFSADAMVRNYDDFYTHLLRGHGG